MAGAAGVFASGRGAAQTAVELSRGLQVRADRMAENLALLGGQPSAERLAAAPRRGW